MAELCELCSKPVEKGYLVITLNKSLDPYVICSECGKPIKVDKKK